MSELDFWKDLGNIFDAVLNYQKKNVEFNNRFINPWIRLGNVFERQDQNNRAVQAYQRATEIDPDNLQNWVELGDAQFKNKAYDKATEAYRKAVAIDPEAGWPLGNLALSLVSQGKIDEAIPLYQKSIYLLAEVKDKAICWNRLGNAYRKISDYEKAFLAFQTADQLDIENTGFSDKLDETPSEGSMIAPKEILEHMVTKQATEDVVMTMETTTSETAAEPTEEGAQIETELASVNAVEAEIDNASIITISDTETEEQTIHACIPEIEKPPILQEKDFEILQVVEDVIAKVEQQYARQEVPAVEEVQMDKDDPVEVELADATQASVQDDESVTTAIEAVASEGESETEIIEKVSFEIETITEYLSEVLQGEESIMPEEVTSETETTVTLETPSQKAEVVTVAMNEDLEPEGNLIGTNEVSKETPVPVSPAIQDDVKVEVSQTPDTNETQAESLTALSVNSSEMSVSESVTTMDMVMTYTDPLAAQLTTGPSLGEGIPEETNVLVEDQTKHEAEVESQELTPADEFAAVKESPTVIAEAQTSELAYEEYLKDMVGPTSIPADSTDKAQSATPVTKVSKDGELRIAMDTKNAHVWNELGNIYLNANACDDAIASYSKAIELDSHFAWPYSNLALAYVQMERFAEAILLYQRGIELFTSDKDKAITWNRLGNVYRRVNDYNNAIAAYQTADELDPENATLSLRSSFSLLGNMYSDPKPAYAA